MSDMKVELKESLTRQQVADRLSALARAIAEGGKVDLELGEATVTLRVPDNLRTEFEVEVEGDELELELEFKWSRTTRAEASPGVADKTEQPQPQAIPAL
jgi:amphi-Trp domain-containing protein